MLDWLYTHVIKPGPPIVMSRFARHPLRNTLIIALLWTAIVAFSLGWSIHQENQQVMQLATSAARSNFDKDLAYRTWASGHGGNACHARRAHTAQPVDGAYHRP